jgi:hypothetical protein
MLNVPIPSGRAGGNDSTDDIAATIDRTTKKPIDVFAKGWTGPLAFHEAHDREFDVCNWEVDVTDGLRRLCAQLIASPHR